MSLARRATIVSTTTASILFIMKVIVGVMSGSVAILASAIDSTLDMLASLFNYFAVRTAEKPPNEKFNYGRGKIEALAAVIEGVVVTISGVYIFYESINKYLYGSKTDFLGVAILVMVISFFITLLLVLYLKKVAKKTNNLVIASDALHYQTDLLSNGSIVLSLLFIYFLGYEIIDVIVALLVGIYIIFSAFGLIKNGVFVLLDASLENDLMDEIGKIIKTQKCVTSFHLLRSRSASDTNFIDMHLVFYDTISLLDAHKASEAIEEQIRCLDSLKKWDISMHLDPYNDIEDDKKLLDTKELK